MITIGADPELLLRDRNTGAPVAVCGKLGGSKGSPEPLFPDSDSYGYQEDNVALEFNIPPVQRERDFARAITRGINGCIDLVRTRLGEDVEIDTACGRLFPEDLLEHPTAKQFGCSPDNDGYDGGSRIPPVSPDLLVTDDGSWRFVGGHVHLGYDSQVPPHIVATMCDLFLGLPSIGVDVQGERRKWYGSAGRYRETSYGIEYRTLSNFWLFDEDLTEGIAKRAFQLLHMLSDTKDCQKLYREIPWAEVETAINTENADMAGDVLAYAERCLYIQLGG